jgi:Uma2 family endonuclease
MGYAAEQRARATYADYLAVPAHQAAEILDGELYTFPRPAPRHVTAASNLGMTVGPPYSLGRDGPGGWRILMEPELQLVREEPVSPDLAGWRLERMPELPATAFFALAPDWVCEVLSPSTEKHDRDRKMPLYAAHGVLHAWLLDPVARILEVYTLRRGRWSAPVIHTGSARVRVAPFEAIEIELAVLWGK